MTPIRALFGFLLGATPNGTRSQFAASRMHKRPREWGPLRLYRIEQGDDFWALMDDVMDDREGAVGQRDVFAKA